ncbi:MAG: hypothetical protein JST90_19570 [Bacteroidetes bacterium]|nr:hypothetical protein [Bacteroidota bacterium]
MSHIAVRVTAILLLLLAGCSAGSRLAATTQPSCAGSRIRSVMLIETDNCDDLPALVTWLDSCRITSGILLLYDIHRWGDTSVLGVLRPRGMYIQYYTPPADMAIHDVHAAHAAYAAAHTRVLPDTGLVSGGDVVSSMNGPAAGHILYVSGSKSLDLSGLLDDQRFRLELAAYGYDSICYRHGLLQGGDELWTRNHLILGRTSLDSFSATRSYAEAEARIREVYSMDTGQTIEWLITDNKQLYHLDLFVTYAGQNYQGKEQFFIGYPANHIEGPDSVKVKRMALDLDTLTHHLDTLLQRLYPGSYDLCRVPFFSNGSLISPLNGLANCIDGQPVYCMPYPVGAMSPRPDPTDSVQMMAIIDTAYRRMSAKVKVQRVNVPESFMAANPTGGGQSLHCMVAVLRRDP